ncbi:hypothetical protein AAVH_29415, partial [Aphelenchoides avenae]
MDSSTDENNTGSLAQWKAFFRACEIPRERSRSHAAKFVEVFARPRKLSTYTKDDYDELGVKFGDRKAIEEYLKATNGNPPEFADYKPTVRTPSAVAGKHILSVFPNVRWSAALDDVIWEPSLKVAAQPSKPERKLEISKRRSFSAASTRRSFISLPATSPATPITSIARSSSTCSEPLLCKQEDNSAYKASADRVPRNRPPAASRTILERPLSGDKTAPSPHTESIAVCMLAVAAPAQETQVTAATAGTMVASLCKEASPSGGFAGDVERQASGSRLPDVKVYDPSEDEEKHDNLIIEDSPAYTDKSCDDALEVEVMVPVSELPLFASECAGNGDEKPPVTHTEETTEASTLATDDVDDNVRSAQADVVDDGSASGSARLPYVEADTSVYRDLFGTTHDASLRTIIQIRHDSRLAGNHEESRAADEQIEALRIKIKKIKNSRKRAERLTTERRQPATVANQVYDEEFHTISTASVPPPVDRDRLGPRSERKRRTGKRAASPPQHKDTDAKRPRTHQQMLRTISNTLGNKNEAVRRRMTMIDKLEKELAENPLGPPWKQRISAKRAADWRRDREERVRQYKGELPEIEKELVEWQKTRIVYKALHAYYRKRHEEDKFIEKLAQDGYTNPIQILADLWSSESAS